MSALGAGAADLRQGCGHLQSVDRARGGFPKPWISGHPLLSSGGLGHQGMHPEAVQPPQVVGESRQIPFEADFGLPSQQKLPEAHGGFDDADDGLDGLLPLFV